MKAIKAVSERLLGTYLYSHIAAVFTYIIYKKNPLVQMIYLLVAVGGFFIYVTVGFFKYIPGPYVGGYHKTLGTLLTLACYYSFFIASTSDPGILTKGNIKKALKRFDYDNNMYLKGAECSTCKMQKPARSKHCAMCDMCVEKFDHHCIWINNCVGLGNYRYFITFTVLHMLLCWYGAAIGVLVFWGIIDSQNLWNAKFANTQTGEEVETTFYTVVKYVCFQEFAFSFIVLVCIVMGALLTFFSAYHLMLASSSQTTNERYKRAALMSFYHDKKELLKGLQENPTEFKLAESEKKLFKIDESMTKNQIASQLKQAEEAYRQVSANFYRPYSRWECLNGVFFPSSD